MLGYIILGFVPQVKLVLCKKDLSLLLEIDMAVVQFLQYAVGEMIQCNTDAVFSGLSAFFRYKYRSNKTYPRSQNDWSSGDFESTKQPLSFPNEKS